MSDLPYDNRIKRWDIGSMSASGKAVFKSVYRQKQHLNHNHDIHFLSRDLDTWLQEGISTLTRSVISIV